MPVRGLSGRREVLEMSTSYYLGVDIGSSSVKAVMTDEDDRVVKSDYRRNLGITSSMGEMVSVFAGEEVRGVGVTGSGRDFARVLLGGDVVMNEIIAHATAAMKLHPGARTVFEIGGEDSKLVIVEGGVVTRFAMNTSCSSGTGTMIEAIATRMGVSIEDVSEMALSSTSEVSIAAKCGVFAQSAAVNKRNVGVPVEDILMGVCRAVVDNYFTILVRNNRLRGPYLFQGAVAWNEAVVRSFEEKVGEKIIVPPAPHLMGALGMAVIARRYGVDRPRRIDVETNFRTKLRTGDECANRCEIVDLIKNGKMLGSVGNRCEKCSALDEGTGGGKTVPTL